MSSYSGEWQGFPVGGGRVCAFLVGTAISILSGLFLAYMYMLNPIPSNTPNYYWAKFSGLFSGPEVLVPISGLTAGSVLIVLSLLPSRRTPESRK